MKIARLLIVVLPVVLLVAASSVCMALTTTTTTLTSSLNPSIYGQTVTFTAVVAPAPPNGESVTFEQGSSVLGTGTLSGGTAIFATSTSAGGTDTIKAVYASDGTYAGSTSNAVKQVVDAAATTTTLVSLWNPANVGQSVTFQASVTPQFSATVTGNVTFYNGNTRLGSASLSGGVADYTTTNLKVGSYSITAVYKGSSSFATSTSGAVSQTVGAGNYYYPTMTWPLQNGITRYYEVFVPTVLPANPPLLLMLHGTRTTPATGSNPTPVITLNWGWAALANQYGFILVQPASTFDPATNQWNWNSYFMASAFPASFGPNGPDDSGFLGQLIQNLTAQYNVNPNMVYVTGFSSGAQMTERVGNDLSNLVAAIVPVSGQIVNEEGIVSPPLPLPTAPNPFPPISVQEWHGTADDNLIPCGYGTTSYSNVRFTLDTVDDTFNNWVALNSCTTLQTTQPLCTDATPSVPNNSNDWPTPGMSGNTGNIATGCANNVEVQFIWEPGVGHAWTHDLSAIWAFLSSHPK